MQETGHKDMKNTAQASSKDVEVVRAFLDDLIQNSLDAIKAKPFNFLEKRLQGVSFVSDINGTLDLYCDETPNPLDQFLCDLYDRGFPVALVSGEPSKQLQYDVRTKIEQADGIANAIHYKPEFKKYAFLKFDDEDCERHFGKCLLGIHAAEGEDFFRSWIKLSEEQKNDALEPLAELHHKLQDMDYVASVCAPSTFGQKLKPSDIEISAALSPHHAPVNAGNPVVSHRSPSKLERSNGALKKTVNTASHNYYTHKSPGQRPYRSERNLSESSVSGTDFHGDN